MAGRETFGMRIQALLWQNVPKERSLCLGYPCRHPTGGLASQQLTRQEMGNLDGYHADL